MKNTNSKAKKKGSAIKALLGVVFLIFLLLVGHTITIWVLLDFNPHFLQIDTCLDHGGMWDDATVKCIKE